MRRSGLLTWRADELDAIPRWLGFVRHFELSTELAPIPLNLVLAIWHWLINGMRWRFLPRAVRFAYTRRALRNAFERGREVGNIQGRDLQQMEQGTDARDRS